MTVRLKMIDFESHLDRFEHDRHAFFNHQLSGVKATRRDLNTFCRFMLERRYDFITGDVLLEFVGYVRLERMNQEGATNRKISSLRSYIKYLRFKEVAGAQELPIEYLSRVRGPYPGPYEALSYEEVQRILDATDRQSVLGYRDYVLYALLYRLGLRIGETLNIDLDDIDFDKELITIHGKGRRDRILPLLPDIIELLSTWIQQRSVLHNAAEQAALFISKKGNRLAARTAQENFQKLVKEAGPFSIKKVTPHSLRHAFATHAVEGNQNLVVLKAIMGHASINSTEIYLHPSLKTLRKAVNDHIAAEILEDMVDSGVIIIRKQQRRKSVA